MGWGLHSIAKTGKHLMKARTKQQSIVATSSAEAELYAGNRAAMESMGVQAYARNLRRTSPIRLHIDSSAALSIVSRTGLGKAKRIEIQHLCLQESARIEIPSHPTLARSTSRARAEGNLFRHDSDTCVGCQLRAHWPRLSGSQKSVRIPNCMPLTFALGGA